MDFLQAERFIRKQILSGAYGPSGYRMPSIQALAQEAGCAYVTAVKAVESLRESGLIMLHGRCHYITTGRCAPDSELEERLKRKRRPCFAILTTSIDNPYYSKMSETIQQHMLRLGYDVVTMINANARELELHQMELALKMDLSGVFFFPHNIFKNRTYFECYPLPVVAVGRQIRDFTRSTIMVDNYDIGKYAADHLKQCGYQDFYYIGFRQASSMMDMRMSGFIQSLKHKGVELPQDHVVLVDDISAASAISAFVRGLRGRDKPIGLFAYHDLLAYEVLKACKVFGVRVPEELGIVGCDDLPVCQLSSPTLTSLRYQYDSIAQKAVDMMLMELHQQEEPERLVATSPKLILRESTLSITEG